MRRLNAVTVLVTSIVLVGGILGSIPASAAVPAAHIATSDVQRSLTVATRTPPPNHYTPVVGVKVNNPLGTKAAKRRIVSHLLRTINSVPYHGKIRIATWNYKSREITDALIAAHRRGVSVRVVIDRLNANADAPNPPFWRLTRALKGSHNQARAPQYRSFTQRCVSSCRGRGGIAHVKFYTFSKAGQATDIVEYGSFNATDVATRQQWNDLYTVRGKPAMYDQFNHVFDQMVKDKPVAQPFLHYTNGKYLENFYPFKGQGTAHDPILSELNRTNCSGATGGTGVNGHTKIRIAQTSMHGDRGKALASRLRQMWVRGCSIKIVYAVFGNEVLNILRHTSRGPVPIRQIAQDFDKDGVYDRYLHMKTMAISGVWSGRTNANVTWNGSANWTGVALASDEVVVRIFDASVRRTYSDWFDYLFAHPPAFSNNPGTAVETRLALKRAIANGIDPYSKMQLD